MRHLLICFVCVGGGEISSRWSTRDVSPDERRDFPSDAKVDACHEIQDGVEYQLRSYGSSDKKVNRIISGDVNSTTFFDSHFQKRLLITSESFCFYVLLFMVDQATGWKSTKSCLND